MKYVQIPIVEVYSTTLVEVPRVAR